MTLITYTAETAGLYHFSGTYGAGHSGSTKFDTACQLCVNGTSAVDVWTLSVPNFAGNNWTRGTVTLLHWLEAGDIVTIQLKNTNWSGSSAVWFDVVKIY